MQSHICQFHKPLMKLLQDNGYEVHVASRNNLAEKNGLAMEFADKVFDIPFDRSPFSMKNIKAFKELSKVLAENEYDFIHADRRSGRRGRPYYLKSCKFCKSRIRRFLFAADHDCLRYWWN